MIMHEQQIKFDTGDTNGTSFTSEFVYWVSYHAIIPSISKLLSCKALPIQFYGPSSDGLDAH